MATNDAVAERRVNSFSHKKQCWERPPNSVPGRKATRADLDSDAHLIQPPIVSRGQQVDELLLQRREAILGALQLRR